ncbi:hypothetical protein DENIS_3078 [Desulfonema ishimotonii]|uniref:histidine kinase n=1 Tax=Desulfonema ishimotonii TaxID=45657 RepID=A0A401FYS9_9BACT|nr:PocR ligand-binding domain-containing protein [Desulfonema ishimotonii]GBC62115.1 hypothetical protein DENIS_3078 [Desulfonema ishimotonii]
MTDKPTYEELERRVKELLQENLELKKDSAIGAKKYARGEIESEMIPEEHLKDVDLQSIINIDAIQSIMDDFHYLTGMVTAVLDMNGNVIEATGWQDICTRFHRIHPQTAHNCTKSDLYLSKNLRPGEYVDYKCKNGLWDVVTPLYVGTKHLGNIYTGQFFYDDDQIDEETFIRQAEMYGFDKDSYLDALRRIPRYSRKTVEHLMNFLVKFTVYISKIGFANNQLENEIRERKRSESALQKSEEQLRAIFEAADNVSFIITDAKDPEPTIREFSPGAEHIFGYSKNEVMGKPVSILHIPDDVKNFPKAHQQMRDGKSGFSGETTLIRKSGEKFPALFSTYPLLDGNGKMYAALGVSFDVTEQKKLEGQLFQSWKMESIGRLAGGIAHDFNNMLSIILGNSEMIIEEMGSGNPVIDNIEEIRRAAERSAELTRQLLTFARKQTIVPKVIDLNDTIEGMLKMLIRLIGEHIDLVWLPKVDLWSVKVDPSQVDQMLANLCINARDSIKGVGKITIETGNVNFDEEYCRQHNGFNPGDFTVIAVSDNGCGMDRKTLDNLFEPFFTTKDVGQGTGLGLATVYGIVRQNGGFINVYSEMGEGTTFKIYLPRNVERAMQAQKHRLKDVSGNETILLVEDETAVLRMTAIILERLGYTVLSTPSPTEAIRICESHSGKIHMIITDVVMPEMSGRDLAKKLLRLHPKLKCLFMSGYTANVIAHHGVLDEGIQFINKPFSKRDLSVRIREVLDEAQNRI